MNQLFNLKVDIAEKPSYNYEIIIGNDLLKNTNEIIKNYTNAKKFLVVTNETIYALYKDIFHLENAQFIILPDGEEYKNFENLQKILDKAVEEKLERKDCIVALGGGVVGDIAGFAAATYMRGIDFIQIPTTLLAMVDSSVGGKVAINHANGKNLIGAFYQPKLVLTDIETLKTLPLRQLKTGLGEVLKYAFIEKSCNTKIEFNFFDFLKENKNQVYDLNFETISQLVKICCELKAAVVNQDETEKGLRAILNLGHTFAHAIENLTNYTTYTHGEAVAIGLKMAFNLAVKENLINEEYKENALGLINLYEITPTDHNLSPQDILEKMFLDKKAQDGKIRFALPDGKYSVKITNDVTTENILACL